MPWDGMSADGLAQFFVTPPGGPEQGPFDATTGVSETIDDANGNKIAEIAFSFDAAATARGLMELEIYPTASLKPGETLSPPGRWQIRVVDLAVPAGKAIHAWVRRDETLPGFPPGGRQPYFDMASYERFDAFGRPLATDPTGTGSPVRRAGTLNGFACSASPLVVAGMVRSTGELADYSAQGPISPPKGGSPNRPGPDAAAVSDDSLVLDGVLGAGSSSGSIVAMNGTSVAAPQVARNIANALAGGLAGTRAWLVVEAVSEDAAWPPPRPAASRTGGGRLDLPFRIGPPRL